LARVLGREPRCRAPQRSTPAGMPLPVRQGSTGLGANEPTPVAPGLEPGGAALEPGEQARREFAAWIARRKRLERRADRRGGRVRRDRSTGEDRRLEGAREGLDARRRRQEEVLALELHPAAWLAPGHRDLHEGARARAPQGTAQRRR